MFYLTLPSNSSFQFYPNNTLAHFTTQLAKEVDLQGQWEVGLSEIQYPHTWHNMNEKEGWINFKKNNLEKRLVLPPGQYDTPEQLTASLNQFFVKEKPAYRVRRRSSTLGYMDLAIARPISTTTPRNESPQIIFTYHPITKKASVTIQHGCEMDISPTLVRMLGLVNSHMSAGTYHGVHNVDVHQGFYSLYIYCDVVDPQSVGDTQVPLLRIVPIEGESGQMITKTYEHIQYVPLLRKHFHTIEIDIKKDTGESVPFELGELVVTLHFRKQRPSLLG